MWFEEKEREQSWGHAKPSYWFVISKNKICSLIMALTQNFY